MKRIYSVYGLLIVIGIVILVWQIFEHSRLRDFERRALLNRARDISNTLGIVIRSMRRPGGVIDQNRLEAALEELVKMEELESVALLNASDEIVTSAGISVDLNSVLLSQTEEQWARDTVIFTNLVDLGVEPHDPEERDTPPILMRLPEFNPRNQPPPPDFDPRNPPGEPFPREIASASPASATFVQGASDFLTGGRGDDRPPFMMPPPEDDRRPPPPDFEPRNSPREPFGREIAVASPVMSTSVLEATPFLNEGRLMGGRREPRGNFRGRGRFFRPFWMDEKEFQSLIQKQGLHKMVMILSTDTYRQACLRDISIRSAILLFASIAIIGFALAWRSLVKSADLQVRLVRAREINTHLRERNLAAAGLAHETKNPLNIVRGLAQLIAKQPADSTEIQDRSHQIMEEVDRVTVQLNEFIEYSKPRESKPVSVYLHTVIHDVRRALETDMEDKQIQFQTRGTDVAIEADELLLRQVLFNLLLNSIHWVQTAGRIEINVGKDSAGFAYLEVQDNGPGIPTLVVDKIFQPYFTTSNNGTGLGLAVVHQIVRAHGWEIKYIVHSSPGACFRISKLKISTKVSLVGSSPK